MLEEMLESAFSTYQGCDLAACCETPQLCPACSRQHCPAVQISGKIKELELNLPKVYEKNCDRKMTKRKDKK
jgi:hypothetical protein